MRLQISKSKNAESFYIVKSVYNKGVRTSKIVKKLGTYNELKEKLGDEDPYEWAKIQVEELNRLEKEGKQPDVISKYSPSKQINKDIQRSFNGGYLFLQDIYYKLGLNNICKEISSKYKFTFDLNSILSRLIYSRVIFPASKLATSEASKKFIEQPNFELQHVYRALEFLSKETDYIQSELYKNSLKMSKRNTGILYYDCTNFFFEIEQEEGLKQYGKSKENRPNPIVQMGLFMDGDGIPLAFNITKGNTNEQITLRPLEEKILSDFELSKFIVCTDAGLSSTANKKFNSKNNRSFITTQSLKKLKVHLKDWALAPTEWYLDGDYSATFDSEGNKIRKTYDISALNDNQKNELKDAIFYKQKWTNEDNFEQNLIITYSLKYKNYQEKIRNRQIERAQKMLDKNPGKYNKKNSNDYRRFIQKTNYTPDGEEAKKEHFSINYEIINEEVKYDGFYAVYTDLEDDAKEIIKVNQRRWEIEESFRIMKSEFKARPVYLKKDDRIQAHFTTCFIALMIFRLLEKKLNEKYTCNDIIQTLRDMNFYEVIGNGYIPIYTRTDLTDALHDVFEFRTDYEIVTTKQMKNIFKSTQK